MDLNALKSLYGQRVTLVTTGNKDFIGTLEPIEDSKSAVRLLPVDDATAAYYSFAINGVAALSTAIIAYVQKLPAIPK